MCQLLALQHLSGMAQTQSPAGPAESRSADRAVAVAVIGGIALVLAALVNVIGPSVGEYLTTDSQPEATPPIVRTKHGLCNDPRTGRPYTYDVQPFNPKFYVNPNAPLGGDSVNPGHAFTYTSVAPGPVFSAQCSHDSTSQEIKFCGPDWNAKGQPTKLAVMYGWVNGDSGPDRMTVLYQMPCLVRDTSGN